MSREGMAIFRTTAAALRAERLLAGAGIGARAAAAPRELSRDCSLGVRFAWEAAERVHALLQAAGVPPVGLHPLGEGRGEPEAGTGEPAAAPEPELAAGAAGAVVVAMSGGVDSAVAAALLHQAGVPVVGVTLRVWSSGWRAHTRRADRCCSLGAVADARAVAERLGIDHAVLDCEAEFEREVIQPFLAAYLGGRTPNPCLACNSRLKFAWLRERARAWGAVGLATGHYARVTRDPVSGRYQLRRGRDPGKDQSYFLYRLTQAQLADLRFPLGELHKAATRQMALRLGLPVAGKPESQEICFAGGDYRAFLRERVAPAALRPGPMRDTGGRVLGRHAGLALFTVGQRHGLGLGTPTPRYVVALDPARDEVVVGEERELWTREATLEDLHLIAGEPPGEPLRVLAQLRSAPVAAPATLCPGPGGTARLVFEQPQRGVAPGQAAVCYAAADPELVLGGGTICGSDPAAAA